MDLAVKIYQATKFFPVEEIYGLTSQIKRSAVSITSNIAQGSGRNRKKDFNYFLGISNGSSCELETQLLIANRVEFLDDDILHELTSDILEIQKMNWALKKSLAL
jgi:four helix bundle protein